MTNLSEPSKKPKGIRVKKLNDTAVLPCYKTSGSSGADLYACLEKSITIEPNSSALIPTGISLEIPTGFEGQVRSRSGLAAKSSVFVLNSPGTIDSDYRGEVKVVLYNLKSESFIVENKDRIAQIVFAECVQLAFEESGDLENTERGDGSFGSTGVKW